MTPCRRTCSLTIFAALALALVLTAWPPDGMGSSDMTPSSPLPALIPAPTSWRPAGGTFVLTELRRIVVAGDGPDLLADATGAAARLADPLARRLPVQAAGAGQPPAGSLVLRRVADLPDEAYDLRISPTGLELSAAAAAGFHHGVSTLIQMIVGNAAAGRDALPAGLIRDEPRFAWRGMLLDCGRHFMSVAAIKRVIDQLTLHKFNVLHWHLTEDQGWRLEVPAFPRLTEIGAWRTEHDGTRHGGFYTAADVREVVAYAADRFITVVPEIEMPGHSQAALAAYPELSCTGGPFAVQTQWGVHHDVYCAGREETFAFLEAVLTHVMELFPGRDIHIGGDEVPKDRWRACPRCQERIRAEGLADEDDLQSWFIARIATFLGAHDRRLIGWDEILDGGLPGDPARYTVQAWRGLDKAAEAARAGHEVIASPTSHAYFDYDPGVLGLHEVFEFRPVPEGLDEAATGRIRGGQMNLWTEYIPEARLDTMLFPRLTAMAEALWTGADDRDFHAFLVRLDGHRAFLDHLGVRPGAAARPLAISGRFDLEHHGHQLEIARDDAVATALAGQHLESRYLILESPWAEGLYRPGGLPEELDLPAVTAADDLAPRQLELPSGHRPDTSWLVLAALFANGRPYGAPALAEVSGHQALGAELSFAHPPSERYPGGGPLGLVDGFHGSRFFRDGFWSGFERHDGDVTLDLGRPKILRQVSVRFLQDANSWIFLPREVRVQVSTDGTTWRAAGTASHDLPDKVQEKTIHQFNVDLGGEEIRYLRVVGVNPGVCPPWHPGRGRPCWVFCDEIVCR